MIENETRSVEEFHDTDLNSASTEEEGRRRGRVVGKIAGWSTRVYNLYTLIVSLYKERKSHIIETGRGTTTEKIEEKNESTRKNTISSSNAVETSVNREM